VRIDVAFTPAEVRKSTGRRVVVVIDLLRATSTMLEALANGARGVLPVGSVEDAVRKAEEIGRDAVLLAGERECLPIPGFQLGNSPAEYVPPKVRGRTIIMTTTNGTAALLAAAGARHCYIGSLMNAGAVARRIAEHGDDALLLCSGKEGGFAAEDALCAGRILRRLRAAGARFRGNDAARVALRLAGSGPVSAEALARTAAGRRLRQVGLSADIAFCAVEDRHDLVPVLDGHRLRL
jgi:2-phosphosulfolactate phosphatase